MTIESRELEDGITRIDLAGRMDIAGTEQVDLRFSGITSTVKRGAVVDMSAVTFLASIGIRTLITNAKSLKLRGASLVLVRPSPLVAEVLRSVGIHDIIPIFEDLEAAVAAIKAAPRAAD